MYDYMTVERVMHQNKPGMMAPWLYNSVCVCGGGGGGGAPPPPPLTVGVDGVCFCFTYQFQTTNK